MATMEKADRRLVPDRRKQLTPFISKYRFIGGQRRTIARKGDKKKYIFVDWYSPQLFITLLFLLILSVLDAYFTLSLMKGHGMAEVNPIMALYLECGEMSFIICKFLITTVSIFIFCLCSDFFIAKLSLASSVIMYFTVVSYELNILYKFFDWL